MPLMTSATGGQETDVGLIGGRSILRIVPGIEILWAATMGSPEICIALLDGPVDFSHPCFAGANLESVPTLAPNVVGPGAASAHGTHTASIIFGRHGSPVTGLAPRCRGLIVPIFTDRADGSMGPCSQLDLARAIEQAVDRGAHIINVSGGQLSASGDPDPMLLAAIKLCRERNVLIVAAAGNDGCECLHVPASVDSTLAVGALDERGLPMSLSNWGEAYRGRGIMAAGTNIPGALPGGQVATKSGTSFATPIVSAVAALLLSRQLERGDRPDPRGVCAALLQSAIPCNTNGDVDCRRLLAGTLNVPGALPLILKGNFDMSDTNTIEASDVLANATAAAAIGHAAQAGVVAAEIPAAAAPVASSSRIDREAPVPAISASGCACGTGGAQGPALVYALGSLGYDFGSEARRDSFAQAMPNGANNPDDPRMLLAFLEKNIYYAQSLIWTVNLDVTPIYSIVPSGAYAPLAYEKLVAALRGTLDQTIVMNSFPGVIYGSSKLISGQVVPTIEPAVRGMYSWSLPDMTSSILGDRPSGDAALQKKFDDAAHGLTDFLNRIYYEFRNLGVTSADRALNSSATNAIQVMEVLSKTTKTGLQLDTITTQKSPICRPDSDCYDIILQFFNPENMNVADVVFRFAIDVSDVIPVSVGQIRSWSQR